MARLPTPGSDDGKWGQILNDYLSQSHNNDGTIKVGAVTKSDIGLGNVDNTSDINKPLSAAAQTALDAKIATSALDVQVAGKIQDGTSATATALSASAAAVAAPLISQAALGPARLKRFRLAVGSRDTDGLRIMYGPGASTLQGQGATTMARRSIERIGARLAQQLQMNGSGTWIAPHPGAIVSPAWPVTLGGTGANRRFDFGIGLRCLELPISATATYTFTTLAGGSPLGIAYRRGSSTGTISYSIDGGSAVTVTTSGSVTEFVKHLTTSLPAGPHTIVIGATGATIYIEGLNPNPNAQLQMFDYGAYGSSTATWDTNGYSAISAIDPHLCVMCFGTNDQVFGTPNYSVPASVFKIKLQNVVTRVRAQKANVPILITAMPAQDTSTYAPGFASWASYIAAMAEVAAANAEVDFFDAGAVLGPVQGDTLGLYADTAHMNDRGHGWWSDVIAARLTAGI